MSPRNLRRSRARLTTELDAAASLENDLGRITIADAAIAQIVAHAAAESYGVVGMVARGRERVSRLLPRGRSLQGITVTAVDGAVSIDLHVVVEHGLNLGEVAATVRSRVTYEVERLTGLRVSTVDVHIDDVRRSA